MNDTNFDATFFRKSSIISTGKSEVPKRECFGTSGVGKRVSNAIKNLHDEKKKEIVAC